MRNQGSTPRLTEAAIRELADESSFERGWNYYSEGAIEQPARRGNEISGLCYGSREEPYRVWAVLEEDRVLEAYCTCPRGGFCKHIVALLLTYVYEPEAFCDLDELAAGLARLSKEELVRLIVEQAQRDSSFLREVRREVSLPAPEVDAAMLRREVYRALRRKDPYDMDASLRDLLEVAESLAAKEDWLGAGTVYKEVLAALAACYGANLSSMDNDGILAALAGDCVEGLSECLRKSDVDAATREAWLATLLEAKLADIAVGGVGFAEGAFEVVLDLVTPGEWSLLEERVRTLIPKSEGWTRESLVNLLVRWNEKHGRQEEARRVIRELGTPEQVMFLAVREGEPAAAVAIAREHCREKPGVIIQLVQALAEAGSSEHAALLLTELANSDKPNVRYLEWLGDYFSTKGDWGAAFKWRWAAFTRSPSLPFFRALRETSKKLGIWEEVRASALQELEDTNKAQPLIEIALDEGNLKWALELLARVPPYLKKLYYERVAEAAEKERPLDAVRLYEEIAEATIGERQRNAYRQAATYLRRMKKILDREGKRQAWEKYLADLKKRYARYPALLDELRKARL